MEKFPLQDDFLADMCQTQAQVSISLLNGVRLEGTIESSDQFTVLLKKNKDSQLIYKHLISSIVPLPIGIGAIAESDIAPAPASR